MVRTRVAASALAVASLAVQPRAWDGHCYGIWTEAWATRDHLPDTLRILNRSGHEVLKDVVLSGACPYGYALPGQVTWPSPPAGLGEAGIVRDLGAMEVLMVMWSYLPWAFSIYIVLLFLVVRGTRQLWVLSWLLFFITYSEVVLKTLVAEPRPGTHLEARSTTGLFVGSCLDSCGMPSSHAGITTGLFLLLFLDCAFRVRGEVAPSQSPHGSMSAGGGEQDPYSPLKCQDHAQKAIRLEAEKYSYSLRAALVLPWSQHDRFSHMEFAMYIVVWFLVLTPTSAARLVLADHSPGQVLWGQLNGAVSSFLWWRGTRFLQHRHEQDLGKRFFFGLIVHNFPLEGVPARGATLPRRQSVREPCASCRSVEDGQSGSEDSQRHEDSAQSTESD